MKDAKQHDYALLVLRLIGGLTLLFYGSQKMMGAFGGKGFTATISMFEQGMGIPPPLAICAIFAEFFGALGLVFGFLSRIAAFGAMTTMLVATYVHTKDFTILDPAKVKDLTYPLLMAAIFAAILIAGAGKISVDAQLGKKRT